MIRALLAAVALAAGPAALAPIVNPVPGNFPDPQVLVAEGRYWAYSTNDGSNVPVRTSPDLVAWEPAGDALPELPAWAERRDLWAPGVQAWQGRYLLYYAIRERATGLHCLSVAVAGRPGGPFTDRSDGPLVCQRERGGTIDPDPFVDADGALYLVFKSEGVVGGEDPTVWSSRLTADGLALEGAPRALITRDQDWEVPIVEGAGLGLIDGTYVLLYAGNHWGTQDYAIGHAVCDGPLGPCRKPRDGPLMATTGAVAGPGSPDLFLGLDGALWLAYHAWTAPEVGYPRGARSLRVEPIAFVDGAPVVRGPLTGPVPRVRAHRVAGPDRFATAAALSAASFPGPVQTVTVATGTAFPDALAAAPLAAAAGGPVLLVERDAVPAATAAELARLRPARVVLVGGPAAVSAAVEAALARDGAEVVRVDGADRVATAAAVARAAFPGGAPTALLAGGDGFADALAAGAAGAAGGAPVLLTAPGELPAATAAALRDLGTDEVVVVGGEQRVGPAVDGALAAAGARVRRIAGPDRVATALALARDTWPGAVDRPAVATAGDFPDALAAGALGTPVLLSPPEGAPPEVRAEARRLAATSITVLGGPAALSARAFADLDLP